MAPTKMIVSPPRINLRRAASYNAADRGPLSSSSSRFGFEHLAFHSPPPSPGLPLPQQAPRKRRKSSNTPRPSRVIRWFLWLSGLVLLFFVAGRSIQQHDGAAVVVSDVFEWAASQWDERREYEMIGQDSLPDFPTPVVVTDRRGRAKWTVSIPQSLGFPLSPREYTDMCAKCREVSSRVKGLHSHKAMGIDQITMLGSGGLGSSSSSSRGEATNTAENDKHFVDVREAEGQRLLPPTTPGSKGSGKNGEKLGVDGHSLSQKRICASSLTFVLESEDAGLGTSLMALWIAYGTAKREGRTFFIDDTRWAYGEYTSLFETLPAPDCRPPPAHERLPCPRQARHLVVSTATAREVLVTDDAAPDEVYVEGFSLAQRPGQKALYALAREGYEALFRLGAQDRDYVAQRVEEHAVRSDGRAVGVHVRRGDRRPFEAQYADSYIPLTAYAQAAREVLEAVGVVEDDDENQTARNASLVVLASDDPLVYEAEEFTGAGEDLVRAQELIRLAGKEDDDKEKKEQEEKKKKKQTNKYVMHKFEEETFGWEGGFFGAMFWNLGGQGGGSSASTSTTTTTTVTPSEDTTRLRSYMGRAYLMDLAVLAETKGGGVVCAVSATGCRLLAVMMGEERAFEKGQWRNVDGNFGWSGFVW
ncbi:hypothetical protein M406DRAFT_287415 [Cryphonectria parasitica EP155]|uniref:Uncharacterized protein n=1 Tax=Cryphonectria parasitica (strain ATCC 38755 / EP155) TaxID=660469 RepID=A0A9P4YA93_CRYP1|nr:uncharacterized protein M406DRAFT_287415 [Cryphonectria parasitica EP155]KAF3769289.1 hypothetical protein M406DRAFT_287415 [Cryphonectria parasitica EP155]